MWKHGFWAACSGGPDVWFSRARVADDEDLPAKTPFLDNFRIADKPTGAHVDERGLLPSGGIRERSENWVVRLSDSIGSRGHVRIDKGRSFASQKTRKCVDNRHLDTCWNQHDVVPARFHSASGRRLGGFVIHANLGNMGHRTAALQQ
jgi:hypothetical protein